MKPPPFSYAAPTTLAEAVGLLTEHAEAEPRVLAGGQSLIPLMNFRLAKPGYLIDLRNVAGLSGIRREGDTLVIGAMTTDVGGGAVAPRWPWPRPCWPRRSGSSRTPRCVTAARSAAAWRTPTPRPNCPRWPSRPTRSWSRPGRPDPA